jgi:pyruvate ferredoxin oxidoreductase alpha subunit
MVFATLEGSKAVAQAVAACNPDVVACYPISPSTHIAEELGKHYADGKLRSFVTPEAEFAVLSILIGAAATGARTFTTTSANGLLLMHEPLFCASGMRLPIVILVANRAVSAPLNIWNDEQDSIAQRDSGWIQLYCESNQEACDSMPQAYKIAESAMLPIMVCIDGHYLTHAVEQIEVPTREQVTPFLPPFNPPIKLDPLHPVSLGVYANPHDYQGFRQDLMADMMLVKDKVKTAHDEYAQITGRTYGNGLIEEHQLADAEMVLVGMGSTMANVKAAVDELRAQGKKVGALRIRLFRPFPAEEVRKALEGKIVGVLEKDISPGGPAPVYGEVVEALNGTATVVSSFYGGLGGKEIRRQDIKLLFEHMKGGKPVKEWVPFFEVGDKTMAMSG